jgi:hypothetical protein
MAKTYTGFFAVFGIGDFGGGREEIVWGGEDGCCYEADAYGEEVMRE